jgi:hypothetical protein
MGRAARYFTPASIAITALFALGAAALTLRHNFYPSAGDSWYYVFYAFRFRIKGVLHDFGTVRTYGYPLVLTPLAYLAGYSHARLQVIASVTQSVLYCASVWWLAARLRSAGGGWSLAVTAALLLNPAALVLVTDTLTDGLSLTLVVILAALALEPKPRFDLGSVSLRIFLGAMIAAFGLMVRPSNLPILVAWHLALVAAIVFAPQWREHRLRLLLTAVVSLIIAAVVTWTPQAIYATRLYGEYSVLPICRLGEYQTAMGILDWKYDTVMTPMGAVGWHYLNPLFSGTLPSGNPLLWYCSHPIAGLITLAAHLFMAFSASSPFVYIYDLHPGYGPMFRVINWWLVIAGCMRTSHYLRTIVRSDAARSMLAPRVHFLGFVVIGALGTTAVNGISAVETRFNIFPLSLLYAVAADYLIALGRRTVPVSWLALGGTTVLAAALTGAGCVADQLGQSNFPSGLRSAPNQCYMVIEQTKGVPLSDVTAKYEADLAARRGESR